jgi:hypothetical protein
MPIRRFQSVWRPMAPQVVMPCPSPPRRRKPSGDQITVIPSIAGGLSPATAPPGEGGNA